MTAPRRRWPPEASIQNGWLGLEAAFSSTTRFDRPHKQRWGSSIMLARYSRTQGKIVAAGAQKAVKTLWHWRSEAVSGGLQRLGEVSGGDWGLPGGQRRSLAACGGLLWFRTALAAAHHHGTAWDAAHHIGDRSRQPGAAGQRPQPLKTAALSSGLLRPLEKPGTRDTAWGPL